MKATGIALTVLLGVAIAAQPVVAEPPPFPEGCCACLPGHATTSGDHILTIALACATILSQEELLEFENQCSELGGSNFCVAPVTVTAAQAGDNLDCRNILLIEKILCPTAQA